MLRQIQDADFVLVVCTETYHRRVSGLERAGAGKGARWEGILLTQNIYNAGSINTRFIPVVFDDSDASFIPEFLTAWTHYSIGTDEGFEDLYRQVTGQPLITKPPIGKLRVLPSLADSPRHTPSSLRETTQAPNALFVNSKREVLFACASRIERAADITAEFRKSDPNTASFFNGLLSSRERFWFAFGDDAFEVQMRDGKQVLESGKEAWILSMNVVKAQSDFMSEVAFGNLSADDLALIRAERVLLNRHRADSHRSDLDRVNGQFKESLVQGLSSSALGIGPQSPFLTLYKEFGGQGAAFVAACRLIAVLQLKASNTIDRIYKLDIKKLPKDSLSIEFSGVRPRRYSNQDPKAIKIKGECDLSGRTLQ